MFTGLKNALRSVAHHGPRVAFSLRFQEFNTLLERHNRIQELMADMSDKLSGEYIFDRHYIVETCETLGNLVLKQITELSALQQPLRRKDSRPLFMAFESIQGLIQDELEARHSFREQPLTLDMEEISMDQADAVGRKIASLGQVRNMLSLPTPDGFAVSFKAHEQYWEQNGLEVLIRELSRDLDAAGEGKGMDEAMDRASRQAVESILSGEIPDAVAQALQKAAQRLFRHSTGASPTFAVRSSAWEEDSMPCFAGQNPTRLSVPQQELPQAYRRILASAYSRRCWLYRRNKGDRSPDFPVAVGVHLMVDAEVGGVLYSLDPVAPGGSGREQEAMLVSAVWGQASPVLDGSAPADFYRIERTPPYRTREMQIALKERELTLNPEGRLDWRDVDPALRERPCLSEEQRAQLVEVTLLLERYFKHPLDMEWAFDPDGRLVILQVRPLIVDSREELDCAVLDKATRQAEAFFKDQGLVVQRGVGMGKIFVLRDLERMDEVPEGSILVTRSCSPRLSRVMRKVHGIVCELGSPAGHLANVAREFRVPMLVRVGGALARLPDGYEATLDTEHRGVFKGLLEELRYFELTEDTVFEDSEEYRLLRRVLQRISPLSLVNPGEAGLRPEKCRTLHDICHCIHERAVESIIDISDQSREAGIRPVHLATERPLGIVVLDLGGGAAPAKNRELAPEDIRSTPFRVLLQGMHCAELWPTHPVSVDLGSFMSSFTKTFSAAQAAPDALGRNLALVSRDYCNLSLRLGYHFSMVVANVSDEVKDNYVQFLFYGGVTHVTRRSRRARFVARVLQLFDFKTEVHGDLVRGRFKKEPRPIMESRLRLLGWLIGYTRQLDVLLCNDARIEVCVAEFMHLVEKHMEAKNGRDTR